MENDGEEYGNLWDVRCAIVTKTEGIFVKYAKWKKDKKGVIMILNLFTLKGEYRIVDKGREY